MFRVKQDSTFYELGKIGKLKSQFNTIPKFQDLTSITLGKNSYSVYVC